jgi:uncharacterized NAD-dependent epimerase/dehydratase family protein
MMHDHVRSPNGKLGFGLMRYGTAPISVVIDRTCPGSSLAELTGIDCHAPIVASVREALKFRPDVLIPAIAPAGGRLPADWMEEIELALFSGMSLVNPLHAPLAQDPGLKSLLHSDRWIWDVRAEPNGLDNALGRAREVRAKRVLFVGTDMAIGKMTAALEADREARRQGHASKFIATGQTGILIAGEGVAVDGVRVDYAGGAVEAMVLQHGDTHDVLWVEGQGSLLHPASTATLPLMRGSMPTHMILCHRAGQQTIARCGWVPIPPLSKVVQLYEAVSACAGALPGCSVAGICLNTAGLSEAEALQAVEAVQAETGLPATDAVRFGCSEIVRRVMAG